MGRAREDFRRTWRRRYANSPYDYNRDHNQPNRGSKPPEYEEGPERRTPTLEDDGYTVVRRRARNDAPGDMVEPDLADRIEGSDDPFLPLASED